MMTPDELRIRKNDAVLRRILGNAKADLMALYDGPDRAALIKQCDDALAIQHKEVKTEKVVSSQ